MNVQLNPVEEVGIVAAREVKKNLRSIKGIVLLVLTLGGGGGFMALILPKVHEFEAQAVDAPPGALQQLREQAIDAYSRDPGAAKALSAAPSGILLLMLLTLSLTPAFLAMTGFDVVSSDLQYRGIRYWTVRVRRASYIVGKFVGLWAVSSFVVLLLHVGVWIMMTVRNDASFESTFTWGLRMFAAWLPISAVWAAVGILVGGLLKKPFLALASTLVAIFGLWAVSHILPFFGAKFLMYIWPNEYFTLIAGAEPKSLAEGLGLAVAFVIAAVGGSVAIFGKRDV